MNKYLVGLVMMLLSVAACAGEWPMFMGDSAHSGNTSTGDLSRIHKLSLAWQYDLHSTVVASPIVANGKLLLGAENGNLYTLDMHTHQPLWLFHAAAGFSSTPAVADGVVYCLNRDGKIYALKLDDGSLLWSFATQGEHYMAAHGMYGQPLTATPVVDPWDYYLSSPLVKNGKVYFGSSDENIYALDAKSGALLWRFKTGGVVHSSPAWAGDKIIVGSWDTTLYALDADSGKEAWRFQGQSEHKNSIMLGIQASPSVDERTVYIGARDGYLYALNLSDGSLRWRYDAQGSWVVGTAALDEQALYVGTSDTGLVIAVDKLTGQERYRLNTHNWTYASPVLIANKYLAFGTMAGDFSIIDKVTAKPVWHYQTPERKADEFAIIGTNGQLNSQKLFAQPQELHAAMEKIKRLGAFIASPIWVNNQLVFVNANGQLAVFQ